MQFSSTPQIKINDIIDKYYFYSTFVQNKKKSSKTSIL